MMGDKFGKRYCGRKYRRNTCIGILISAAIILILVLCCTSTKYSSRKTLQLVHMVFRHGDRTPTETYKNDPYINYNWPDGWGSLTNKGKLQLFELGRTLYGRYKSFIDDNSSPNDFLVRSSDADRCHMSAGTFLAGLFPTTGDRAWNPELLWEPIPIHSLPRKLDNIIAMKKPCSTYDKALQDAYNSEEIQKLNNEYKDIYKYLSDNAGQDVNNITAVEFLYNTLEIEDNHGLTLPAWTRKYYPEKMKQIGARSLSIFTETPFMMRMKGGVLIKDMIQQIQKKRANTLFPNRKMFLYSGHDITLTNFLRALGFVEDMKPEYGAAFVLEAHLMPDQDMEIKMLYFNSSNSQEPHVLKMSGCDIPCTFDNFVKKLAHIIPTDWEKECIT